MHGWGKERNVHRREIFFAKSLLIQSSNLKYQLKNKYPHLTKNFTKRYHSVLTHIPHIYIWHEFDNCLCNFLQCKVSCCPHMYFRWRHYLLPDKSENDPDSDWFTYCIDIDRWYCFLVFNIWVNDALEMTINLYHPTLELFCFSFTQPFTHSTFVYPTLFSSAPPPPPINNDRSLTLFQLFLTPHQELHPRSPCLVNLAVFLLSTTVLSLVDGPRK